MDGTDELVDQPVGPPPEDVEVEVNPDGFEDRIVARLRLEAPEETAACSDEQLHDRIRSAVASCLAYDLTTEDQILQFVHASLLLGDDFDSDPGHDWAIEILEDPEMSGDERAAMLAAIAWQLVEEQGR